MAYDVGISLKKGALDGLKTVLVAEGVLSGLTDSSAIEKHVAALVTGIVTGLIRGIANWWKNRKKV